MKKFFQKIGAFVTKIFGGLRKFEKFLRDHADDGLEFVTLLRTYSANPYVLTITALLPKKWQDKVGEGLSKFESILDKVIAELNIGTECIKKETFLERLQCFVAHYKTLSPAVQDALSHKIAALYASHSSGGTVRQHIVDKVIQDRLVDLKNNITDLAKN